MLAEQVNTTSSGATTQLAFLTPLTRGENGFDKITQVVSPFRFRFVVSRAIVSSILNFIYFKEKNDLYKTDNNLFICS